MMAKAFRYLYTTAKQEGGDDGYCYVIRAKGNGREILCGLTARECTHHRKELEREVKSGTRDPHTLKWAGFGKTLK